MMGPKYALFVVTALLCGVFVVPEAASAQCRLCDTPQTQREEADDGKALALEVQAELDFDRLVLLDDASGGVARINPDGSHSTSGALGTMTGRAMVGSVLIRGEPGRLVRIDLPQRIVLHGRLGGTIELGELKSDLPSIPRLDGQGMLRFRFGGALKIQGDIDGDYRGDVPITVEYL